MIYFDEVASNLKGLGRVKLGPKVLVVADCGEGKSRLQEALSLATLNGVPDLDGRAWTKIQKQLCARLGDASGHLWVKAHRSDGALFVWDSKARPVWKRPDGTDDSISPVYAIDAALSGSDEKAHEYLLDLFAARVRLSDVVALLGQDYAEIADVVVETDWDSDPLAALLEAKTALAKQLSDAQGTRRVLAKAGSHPVVAPPLASDFEEIETELQNQQNVVQRADRVLDETPPDLAALAAEGKRAVARLKQIEESLKDPPPELQGDEDEVALRTKHARLRAAISVFETQAQKLAESDADEVDCQMCGRPIERPTLLARLRRGAQVMHGRLQELVALVKARDDARQAVEAHERLRAEAASAARAVEALRERYGAAKLASEQLAGRKAEAEKQRAAAAAAIPKLEAKLQVMREAQAEWKARQGIREEGEAAGRQAERLGVLSSKVESALAALTRRQQGSIAERMQAFMPPRWQVQLDEKPFRLSILRDNRPVPATGAQRNALLAAIASASAKPGSVLLLPERSYDARTLSDLMEALRESPVQVVLTATVEPDREVDGWTILRPGAASAVRAVG